MARMASGREFLDSAKACLAEAKTIGELRQAQAVVFPLKWGIAMTRITVLFGVSESWDCQLRRRFIGAGRHQSAALNLPDNLRLVPLCLYSPEPNPVNIRGMIRVRSTFTVAPSDSIAALEDHL